MQQIESILNHFRANLPVVALSSPSAEELNAIEAIAIDVAVPLNAKLFSWNLASGVEEVAWSSQKGIVFESCSDYKIVTDPILDALDFVKSYPVSKESIFIFVDLHFYIGSDPARTDLAAVRKLKSLCFSLKQSYKRVLLLGQDIKLIGDFEGLIHELTLPLPGSEEIDLAISQSFQDLASEEIKISQFLDRSQLIRSAQGLTCEELRDILRYGAIANKRQIDASIIDVVTEKKMTKLRKLNVEFSNPPDVPIGGLDNLKNWIERRKRLFGAKEINPNLPAPKGIVLVGVPGTGKSLAAKTIASVFGTPMMQVDMSSIYNSLVGESEANLRKLLQTAEAIAPCVMLWDELEKALAGATGASTDSGVSQRLFGTLLQWLNDKTASVFVVATANNISILPPEFLRKGRFDEIFFVDLPSLDERQEIFSLHLKRHQCSSVLAPQILVLAQKTEQFSGAEIAYVIDEAANEAFYRECYPDIRYEDLEAAISQTIPLAQREKERIDNLKAWAVGNARSANIIDKNTSGSRLGSRQVMMFS